MGGKRRICKFLGKKKNMHAFVPQTGDVDHADYNIN